MWSRTSELLLVAAALGACGPDVRTVDVCGRGDRAELAAAMLGGRLVITLLDGDGDTLATASVPATGERASLDFDGARRVRVVGRSAADVLVAEGEAALDGGGACVCLALAGQSGACAGLVCSVEGAACRFYDAATGAPAASRELSLPAADTTLVAAAPDAVHGGEPSLRAEAAAQVALLRFDTSPLPRTAVVEEAFLEVTLLPPPARTFGIPVAVHAVLEPWDEAAATWNQRRPGEPWTGGGGCGPVRCDAAPWAALDPDRAAERHRVPLGTRVAGWVTDPATNHGLVLVGAGGAAAFWSRDGDGAGAAPPRLIVRYHMADDPLPPPMPGPICGNGVVEEGETCDDGDRADDDACTNACAPARCGDGIVRAGVEDCDDGNDVNDDGCTRRCLDCADPNAGATFAGADGRCYARYDTPRSYGVAENSCDEAGHGTLAVFDDLAEQDAVLAGLGAGAALLWIGLSDRGVEGTFVWADGAAPAFTDFGMNEPAVAPASANEDCVGVAAGDWADRGCGETHGYLCERAGWSVDADGRAYLAVLGPTFDWDGARLECAALGAHLAAPTTMAEHARVADLTTLAAWIGLSERDAEGTLRWVTGEPVGYLGFPGAPPGLAGDTFCAQIDGDDDWSVATCAARRRFLCEAE
jgi:cysteine-rich repeat protein